MLVVGVCRIVLFGTSPAYEGVFGDVSTSEIVPVVPAAVRIDSSSAFTVGSYALTWPLAAASASTFTVVNGATVPYEKCPSSADCRMIVFVRDVSIGPYTSSWLKKKNARPRPSKPGRMIGPPMRPPYVWFVACGTGNAFKRLKNVLLLNFACCMNSYTLISNLFVPERVTNRIWIAPWPDASTLALDAVSDTSSTASSRGVTRVKNPSPACSRLLFVTPSIVMLN